MTDPQLAERFEAFHLQHGKNDARLAQLLASLATILPLRRPSNLAAPAIRTRVLDLTDGVTVRIFRLIETVAVEAIRSGAECITMDSFREKGETSGSVAETDGARSLPKRDLPLGMVLSACPDVLDYAKGREIRAWRDFVAAAEQARPALGISPSAWMEAQEAMGPENAAITVAAILQRAERISGGGYLRNLAERARAGKFTVWPMVMALLRAKIEGSKPSASAGRAGRAGGGEIARPDDSSGGGNSSWTVSPALLKSLEKPRRT
ncbi:plasmid replication protein RepC [Xanthobacter dioxanivorans]